MYRVSLLTHFAGGLQIVEQSNDSQPTAGNLSEKDFMSLVVRHERRVRAFVSTLLPLGKSGDVDDIIQEAFIVAWEKHAAFRYAESSPDEEFTKWLCTIAKLKVLSHLRKYTAAKVGVPFDEGLVEELAAIQVEKSSYLEEQRDTLAQCLKKLTDKERHLLFLRYSKDEPISSVALQMNRSVDAAYKAMSKIRLRLLECVKTTLRRA